jgi:amino acid transporter
MSLPLAAFAFVGVEMTAATALEAHADRVRRYIPSSPLKVPSTVLPIIVGSLYFLAAVWVALTVPSDSPSLPALGWIVPTAVSQSRSGSAIVQAAEAANIPALPTLFTLFIVITALTAANTSLYIASRTLFSLTREGAPRWLAWLGVTSKTHQVPAKALYVSCMFAWIPFLSLIHGGKGESGTTINGVRFFQDSSPLGPGLSSALTKYYQY